MFAYQPDTADKFEASSHQVLKDYGVRVIVGRDFEEFKAIAKQARPDHAVQDMFNCDVAPVDEDKAVWMVGVDHADRIIYLQAMRLLPTDGLSVADYLTRQVRDFLPEPHTVDMTRTRYRPGPNAQRMRGRVVYSGEFWIDGNNPNFRGSSLSNVLGRQSYLLAMRAFAPDWIIAFMLRRQVERGAFYRAGFHHAEPSAMRWCQIGQENVMEGAMLYMSAADMQFSLELPLVDAPISKAA
ncbi:MAG: hypothetical protein AAGF60_01905 [Pseudomonadota bacterium]